MDVNGLHLTMPASSTVSSGAYSDIRCKQSPHIPVYGGGGSNDAIQALAPHVDHYMLWGEPLRETAEFMAQVRQAAMVAGKSPPRFSLSTRPILAETDDKAWDRARDILRRVQAPAWRSAPTEAREPWLAAPAIGSRSVRGA